MEIVFQLSVMLAAVILILYAIRKLLNNRPAWEPSIKPFVWLAMGWFGLSLLLPAMGVSGEMLFGWELWLMGVLFIWFIPVSLLAFPNYLLPIVWWRLYWGKSTFHLEKAALPLMLLSLTSETGFGWGYVLWLLSGLATVAAVQVAKGGQVRVWRRRCLVLSVCVAGLLSAFGWWQRHHTDVLYDDVENILIHKENVLFVAPVGW